MKRPVVILLLLTSVMLFARSADAEPVAFSLRAALNAGNGTITVPPEWAGIWVHEDSTYNCGGGLIGVASVQDTLCAGTTVVEDPPDSPITFTCTGFADANTVDMTCTGSGEVFADCQVTFDTEFDATRTGDTVYSVTVSTITYSGTGDGCDFLPDSCRRTVSRSTRIGPAPTEYCASPVLPTTWGQLKVQYR